MDVPEKLKALVEAYIGATGIDVAVVNLKGETAHCGNEKGLPRFFCRMIQDDFGQRESCRCAHLYGGYQAEYFGESYVFFCPFGLVHWAAPVMDQSRMIWTLVAGPVLMTTPDNALVGEILTKAGIPAPKIPALQEVLAEIKIIPPQTVNHAAILLDTIAGHLSRFEQKNPLLEKNAFFHQQASISIWMQALKEEPQTSYYPFEKEKELSVKIRLGDKAGAQQLLNEILGHIFFAEGRELQTVKTRVTELVVMLSRAALEGGADNQVVFRLNNQYFQEVNGLQHIDEAAFWLAGVMAQFTDCVFNLANVKNIDIIYKAVAFMQENYMNDISLEKTARVVNLSPTYFSKLFKEEMRTSFIQYLTNLRVEKSKAYVLNDSIPLADVAGMAGFQDQSYFTKVFKKATGMAPGEFRKSCGLARQIGPKPKAIYGVGYDIAEREENIMNLKEISELLQQGKAKDVKEKVTQALAEGHSPAEVLSQGLLDGMAIIGAKFKVNEVYVPDVLIASRAMNAGMEILKPHLVAAGVKPVGRAVIGTVEGDLHDIGKNLVKIMLESVGLEVIDLGVDVGPDKYVAAVKEHQPRILGMSALLTTTMVNMEKIITALKKEGLRESLVIMVGGAPVTESFAISIGADLYAPDAGSAAEIAREKVL